MSKEAVLQRSRLHWYVRHFLHKVGSRRLVMWLCLREWNRDGGNLGGGGGGGGEGGDHANIRTCLPA